MVYRISSNVRNNLLSGFTMVSRLFCCLLLLYSPGISAGSAEDDSDFLSYLLNTVKKPLHPLPNISHVDPEVYMSADELITTKGYPCEDHKVTTKDGYILTLQRIPHGVKQIATQASKPVVLLQHGLLGESTNYLVNLANESLAFILADAGADVWLGNCRGNHYSREHVKLKPSQEIFWDWSYDEMAEFDLPAMIDYMLATTGQKQIIYVGHSQGTLIGFAGFSQNKSLADKIKLFVALAPIAKLGQIKSPLRLIAPFVYDLKYIEHLLGKGEFLSHTKFNNFLAKDVCVPFGGLCETGFFIIGGFDLNNFNKSRVPVYISHNPSGTSVRNMIHYGQAIRNNTFQKYDFRSAEENTKHYGQPVPPVYHPELMDTPVAIFRGGNDWLADPQDIKWLLPKLKNIIFDKVIGHWEHVDFIYGKDAPKQCYNFIEKLIFD